jgi:hypothetical protein
LNLSERMESGSGQRPRPLHAISSPPSRAVPATAFKREREEEMHAFEEIVAEQIREMSRPEPALDECESAEEDFGYSL